MNLKIIRTTDGQYLGMEFKLKTLLPDEITEATWWKFSFDRIIIEGDILTLQNSNYTAVLKFLTN